MRALDSIIKKRNGGSLSFEELESFIRGYVAGDIPEYQVSAWLMAVYFQGMTPEETSNLTKIMIQSGSTMDLSTLPGPFVDKHSTGGVGDKVSLILAPLAAACGAQVPMMSGRSLGHTGGTLDKLESIPGYTTALNSKEFVRIIEQGGFAMTGQSKEIVPADRLLYALRDATGTVESIPLITGSILSKKFAEGADSLVFDVKTGSGAFMKNPDQARALARSLVDTGTQLGKNIVAVLTRMDEPLGTMVGNFLEVEESVECLKPDSPAWSATWTDTGDLVCTGPSAQLMEVTLHLTAWMLVVSGIHQTKKAALKDCLKNLSNGKALALFEKNIELQKGNVEQMYEKIGVYRAPVTAEVLAEQSGFLHTLDAFQVGMAGVYLGAGRSKTTDPVYPHVGIQVYQRVGDRVQKGQPLFRYWAMNEEHARQARVYLESSITMKPAACQPGSQSIIEEIQAV